jgi:hypothetical protein
MADAYSMRSSGSLQQVGGTQADDDFFVRHYGEERSPAEQCRKELDEDTTIELDSASEANPVCTRRIAVRERMAVDRTGSDQGGFWAVHQSTDQTCKTIQRPCECQTSIFNIQLEGRACLKQYRAHGRILRRAHAFFGPSLQLQELEPDQSEVCRAFLLLSKSFYQQP